MKKKASWFSILIRVVFGLIVVGVSVFCVWMVQQSPILPDKFQVGITVGIVIVNSLSLLMIKQRSRKLTQVLKGLYILLLNVALIIGCVIVNTPEIFLNQLLKKMPNQGIESILVFAAANDKVDGKTLFEGKVALQRDVDQENQQYAIDYINLEYNNELQLEPYQDIFDAVQAFIKGETRFLLVNRSYIGIIEGYPEYENFSDEYQIVQDIKRVVMYEDVTSDTKVASEPFNVLISGEDTRGKVTNVSRSDVNLVMSVNPKTKQILLTSLPRDTYVSVPCWNGQYDKLTHASAASWREPKGIECLKLTVEQHLDIKIDFYIKINFSSMEKIVDALGGVTLDNPYYFDYTWSPYTKFPKGEITLTGKEALLYVRERKSLKSSDLDRNLHQQLMLDAMIRKVSTPSTLLKSKELLDAISGTYMTNITNDQLISLIKLQLEDLAKWNIKSLSIKGQGVMKFSALLTKDHVFGMIVSYPEHLAAAKDYINKVFAGEILTDIIMPPGKQRNIPRDYVVVGGS